MEKEELYKIRSASGCVTAAWKQCCTQLSVVFRRIWLPVTLFALFAAIYRALYYEQSQWFSVQTELTVVMAICGVLMFACCAWSLSRLFQLFNGNGLAKNFKRCAVALLSTCLLFAVIGAAVYGITRLTACNWWVILLSASILTILTLPFHYAHVRYVEESTDNYFQSIGTGLSRGYRYFGRVAAPSLLAVFILLVITAFLAIPAVLMSIAEADSRIGVTIGDPSGMPGSFVWLLSAVTFITVWLIFFAWHYMTVVNIYIYGSIEELHQQRKSTLNPQENG